MMIDLRNHWMWAWRNVDRDQAEPVNESTRLLVCVGLVALIVVPLAIVKLHLDRAALTWLSSWL